MVRFVFQFYQVCNFVKTVNHCSVVTGRHSGKLCAIPMIVLLMLHSEFLASLVEATEEC